MNAVPRKNEQGSSLFEVILAMGLLGVVLGSIAGLFTIGATQVKSGRNASEALVVARSIVEEMHGWSFSQLYGVYSVDGSALFLEVDTKDGGFASKWQTALDEDLSTAHAIIRISALEPGANLANSSQVRLLVTVYWEEGPRKRKLRLGTVRM